MAEPLDIRSEVAKIMASNSGPNKKAIDSEQESIAFSIFFNKHINSVTDEDFEYLCEIDAQRQEFDDNLQRSNFGKDYAAAQKETPYDISDDQKVLKEAGNFEMMKLQSDDLDKKL